MFKKETFKVETDPEELALNMVLAQLGKRGKRIGSGSYGEVYGAPNNDVVYKIGDATDNAGYLAFINTLEKQKTHNPFFPKIYGVRYLKKEHHWREQIYFVVAMEKLKRLSSKHMPVVRFFNAELENDDDAYDLDQANKLLGVKRVVPEPLKKAITVLKTASKNGYEVDWDLHEGNFMLRGNQIVVTDPLS